MRRHAVIVCVLLALLPLLTWSKPMGGKYTGTRGLTHVFNDSAKDQHTTSCRSLALYNSGKVYLTVKRGEGQPSVRISVIIFRSKCANFLECPPSSQDYSDYRYYTPVYSTSVIMNSSVYTFPFQDTKHTPPASPPADEVTPSSSSQLVPTPTPQADPSNPASDNSGKTRRETSSDKQTGGTESKTTGSSDKQTGGTESKTTGSSDKQTGGTESKTTDSSDEPTVESGGEVTGTEAGKVSTPHSPHYTVDRSGVYVVFIESVLEKKPTEEFELKFDLEMKNYYGYLSAIDYPALVFYGLMTAIYAILGIAWSVAMCCSYKDLIRLQFWVFAVIILGFLEKTFFVSEYSSINLGEDSSFLILLAEAISAAKRALARVMLIIVSLGFGTVKPRLGDSLGKVVAVGLIYFIFALIDGIVRAKADTFNTQDTSQIVTLALLFIMDSIIFYWIFTSLVSVRRALRLRKNYVKLSMYNHFAYTLIFAIVAALAFTVWMFVEVNYPKDGCLKDWQEVWLRECFWHFLFCFILIVVMIIWRPSANRNRFAYSLVNDLDEEEEEPEHGENKNFETVKMRTISKSDATPPPVSSQAEDDLRWVEENLPTTAMDKALPLILDSDEEIMNTKFEASKMN